MSAGWNNRRFIAMLRKETLQILRDPSTIVIAFVLPIVLIFLFGYGINLDTARTRIAVSLQDGSQAGQSLAGAFQRSRFFDVAATGDLAALKRDLVSGRVRSIVVIPEEFGRAVARGAVQFRSSPTDHRRTRQALPPPMPKGYAPPGRRRAPPMRARGRHRRSRLTRATGSTPIWRAGSSSCPVPSRS
jgi:hypothetical protein